MDYKEIPIFIINLKKDRQKKEHMQNLCIKNDLHPDFIEAVYGNDLHEDRISQVYSKDLALKHLGRELTKGEIGTALSHLTIYDQIIDQNIQAALILEDDVDFDFKSNDLIHIIEKSPKDWECIMLGHHTKRSRDIDTQASIWQKKHIGENLQCIRFAEQPLGAYGYIINKTGALKRLNDFKTIDRPIDDWNDLNLNLYGIQPAIIKIDKSFLNDSSLTPGRSIKQAQTIRTGFEQFKDKVQFLLKRLHLINLFFTLKNFFIQFKTLKRY